jgi:hypothetical protein
MLKLTLAVWVVAFASTASAAGWRDLRVDASSEAAYQKSLAAFNEELPPERRSVFTAALMDIWLKGTAQANANQSQYGVSDYYLQIHGLGYEEVVTFTDPTGETAKQREREAKRAQIVGTSEPVSPGPATQEQRLQRNHDSLHVGELMRTREGGTVTRSQMPCRGTTPGDC